MSSTQEIGSEQIDPKSSQYVEQHQCISKNPNQNESSHDQPQMLETQKEDQTIHKKQEQVKKLAFQQRAKAFLIQILQSQDFEKDPQECQEIIKVILNKQFDEFKNYFSKEQNELIFKIISNNKEFAHLCQKQTIQTSLQMIVKHIIKQLNVKQKIQQQCEQLLIQGDIEQFKQKINQKQKKKLQQILVNFPQLSNQKQINKIQQAKKEQIQCQNIVSRNSKNNLQSIIQNLLLENKQQNKKLQKITKHIIQLLTFTQKCDQKSIKWFQLPSEQKLIEFQSILTSNFNELNQQESECVIKTIKNCQFLFLISLFQQVQNKLKKGKNTENQSKESLQLLSKKLDYKIDNLTRDQKFRQQIQIYKDAQKCNILEENNQNLSTDQYINTCYQYINIKTSNQYVSKKGRDFKFQYNHQKIQIFSNNLQILQKIQQKINKKPQKLIFFTKKQQSDLDFVPCDIGFLSVGSQFRIFLKESIIFIHFEGNRINTQISKNLKVKQLTSLIVHNIQKNQKNELKVQRVRLNLVFQQKCSRSIEVNQQIFKLENQFGNLKEIQVQLMINVTLYFNGDNYKYDLWQKEPILNLKNQIKSKLSIPIQSQIIQIQSNKIISEIESKQTLEQRKIYDLNVQMTLIVKSNLQFYGFHQNISLKYEKFKQFFIQKAENRRDFLSNCNLRQNEQKTFFDKTIPYIFSALKKRLDLQSVIKLFRVQVSDYAKQEIWTSSRQVNTFNPTFLLYYILYNSEPKLRIQIMNLVKHTMPLPLYFREFSSLTAIQNKLIINEQLIWILKDEFNIVSLGLHTQKIHLQKGKSDLLNKLFYTNFVRSETKHGIASFSPEVSLKVYGNVYNANLIDICSQTTQQTSDNILKKASFVILHSWRSQKQTLEQVQRIKRLLSKDIYILTIMRDISMDSKDNWLIKTKQLSEDKIQLYNLSGKVDPISIEILIKKIKKLVHQKIQSQVLQSKPLVPLIQTSNKKFHQLQKILTKIKDILTSFRTVSQLYKQYQLKFTDQDYLENEVKQNITSFKLHPLIQNLLIFLSKHKEDADILIQRIKDRLKSYKEEIQQKHKIVIYAKKDIDATLDQQSQQYKDKIKHYIGIILQLPVPKFQTNSRINILIGLSNAIEHFNNNIKPEILSLQLLWRQLYLLTEINPKYSFGDQLLVDFIVQMHKKQVFNNQPFELIDGDSLKMPKSVIKKIFDSTKGTAATIIILGPQSSGKSTLLNYLFGCDFKTSEGRCTRGVYGTYYNISNNSMFSCSSIFLIDTEGLLAITNKKDEKVREDFDSKLILFCLAVADFVIVNTKSDLDSETMGKLQACKQRLPTISQGSNPQFWLVMNQSQTSDMTNKANEVNRMHGLFDLGNSRCLSQAFDTIVLGKQQICILGQDVLLKKKSKSDFEILTLKLQSDLMQRVSKKHYRCTHEIIDKMEVIWSTIEKYPDLGKNYSDQIKDIDNKINKWKQQKAEKLNSIKDYLLQKFLQSSKKQQQIISQFDYNRKDLEDEFQKHFLLKDNTQAVNQRIKQKRKVIIGQFDYIFKNLKFGIQDYEMKKRIKIQEQQGNMDINAEIKRIKNIQSSESRELSLKQKYQCFEKVFERTIQKLKKSVNSQKQIKEQFLRVKEYYQSHIKQIDYSSGFEKIMLPKMQKQLILSKTYSQEREWFLEDFYKQTNKSMIIQYSNCPHTNVLVGGKTDATLKYFNMNDYFQKVEKTFYLTIQKSDLWNSIKRQEFIQHVRNQYRRQKQKFDKSPLRDICNQINNRLSWYGLKFKYPQQLAQKIQNALRNKNFLYQIYNFFKSIFKQSDNSCPILIQSYQLNNSHNSKSKFLNEQRLKEQIQIRKKGPKMNDQCLRNLSCAIMRYVIQIKQIQKHIDQTKNNIKLKQNLTQKFSRQIENQLISIGVVIQAQRFVKQALQKNYQDCKNLQQKFTIVQNIPSDISCAQQFFQKIKSLMWINSNELRKCIRQKNEKKQSDIVLAYFKKQVLMPKQEKDKFNIGKYLNEQNREVINYLKSQHTTNFLWEQLMNNKVFKKLFDQFDLIIENSCSKKLSLAKTIQETFSNVVRQIRMFNDDISQLSYKLTFNFQGFCHMYVVRMMWKNLSKRQQGILSKPIKDWIQQKQQQYKYFLNMTSNKIEQICEAQAVRFLQCFFENFQYKVDKIKESIVKTEVLLFKKAKTRKAIQDQIDSDTFKIGADSRKMIQYIKFPKEKVEQKYKQAIQESIKNIQFKMKKQTYHMKLHRQFQDVIVSISKKLEGTYGVSESQGTFPYFFTVNCKSENKMNLKDLVLSTEASIIFMQYFIDSIFGISKKSYECNKFIAILKQDKKKIKFQSCLNSQVGEYFLRIQKSNITVTNIIIFLKKLLLKMSEIKQSFNEQMIISQSDIQTMFTKQVIVSICPQKCPCCDRICGLSGNHNPPHQCVFGHQIRAFGGTIFENGNASVQRCEDMTDTSKLKYNGRTMVWKQFKEEQAKRGWTFDDINNSTTNSHKLFQNAWETVGKDFCSQYKMNFVKFNSNVDSGMVHFIFAIDESGSMNQPKKWPEVIKTLHQILPTLKNMPDSEKSVRISVLMLSGTCSVAQQNESPNNVNFNLTPKWGNTSFGPTFLTAYNLMLKYHKTSKMMFILLTDGAAQFPAQQIKLIKQLKAKSSNKIMYSSIQFLCSDKLMKQISDELQGKNFSAYTQQQLFSAFQSSIELINDKKSVK